MIDLYDWPTPNGHKVTMVLEEADLHYRIHHVDISAGDQFKPEFLAISPNNRMPAGDACTIADMAAYPWIVPWKRQQQNYDFPDLRRWFDEIAARPGTIGAYARVRRQQPPADGDRARQVDPVWPDRRDLCFPLRTARPYRYIIRRTHKTC